MTKSAKTAGAAANGTAADAKKRKPRKTSAVTYKTYLRTVLKKTHPDTSIDSEALAVLDSLVRRTLKRAMDRSSRMTLHNRRKTIRPDTVRTALRLELKALGSKVLDGGNTALERYTASKA
jgi:histone H3/H4